MERYADIHLTVATDVVAGLDRLAAERGMQRAGLVREVLAAYLTKCDEEKVELAMSAYVEALAPHSDEFVRETEAHTIERLLAETEW